MLETADLGLFAAMVKARAPKSGEGKGDVTKYEGAKRGSQK